MGKSQKVAGLVVDVTDLIIRTLLPKHVSKHALWLLADQGAAVKRTIVCEGKKVTKESRWQ